MPKNQFDTFTEYLLLGGYTPLISKDELNERKRLMGRAKATFEFQCPNGHHICNMRCFCHQDV